MSRQTRMLIWSVFINLLSLPLIAAQGQSPAGETSKTKPIDRVVEDMRKEARAKLEEQEALIARARLVAERVDEPGNGRGRIVFRREAQFPAQPLTATPDDEEFSETTREKVTIVTAIDPACFEDWVFHGYLDTSARRTWLESRLAKKMEAVEQLWELTPAQRAKLRLAGRGDINRFLSRVADRRREFGVVRFNLVEGQRFLRETNPLSEEFRTGPFGDQSLLAKTLRLLIKRGIVVKHISIKPLLLQSSKSDSIPPAR